MCESPATDAMECNSAAQEQLSRVVQLDEITIEGDPNRGTPNEAGIYRPYGDNEHLNYLAGAGSSLLEHVGVGQEDLEEAVRASQSEDSVEGTLRAIDALNPAAGIRDRAVEAHEDAGGGTVGVLSAIDALNPFAAIRDRATEAYDSHGGGVVGTLGAIDALNPFAAIRDSIQSTAEGIEAGDAYSAGHDATDALVDAALLAEQARGLTTSSADLDGLASQADDVAGSSARTDRIDFEALTREADTGRRIPEVDLEQVRAPETPIREPVMASPATRRLLDEFADTAAPGEYPVRMSAPREAMCRVDAAVGGELGPITEEVVEFAHSASGGDVGGMVTNGTRLASRAVGAARRRPPGGGD